MELVQRISDLPWPWPLARKSICVSLLYPLLWQTDKQTDRKSDYYRTYAFTMVGSYLSKCNMTVRGYGPDTDFEYVLILTLTFAGMTLGHGHDIPSVHGQLLCKILSRSNANLRSYARTRNLPMCSRWPLPWKQNHQLRSWQIRR